MKKGDRVRYNERGLKHTAPKCNKGYTALAGVIHCECRNGRDVLVILDGRTHRTPIAKVFLELENVNQGS
jgi:hypothetical protein